MAHRYIEVIIVGFTASAGFQIDPQDFTVYSGDNLAVFNCTYMETDYSVAPVIRWELPSRLHDDGSVTIFHYRFTSFIQISNATLYNLIRLRCFVETSGQLVYSRNATLLVSGKDYYSTSLLYMWVTSLLT